MTTAVGSAAEDSPRRPAARMVLLPAAIVLLLGVVALASRAPLRPPRATPLGPPPLGQGPAASPWTLALLGIGAAIVLASLVLHLIWTRRSYGNTRPKAPKELLQVALLMCLMLLGAVLLAAGLGGRRAALLNVRHGGHHAVSGGSRATSIFQFPLWAQLSAAALVLAVCVLTASALGRRWRATDAPTLPTLAPRMTEAIDRSLEDLEADPDARRAIIAAYRRMEESLAHVGLPRGSSETAREYLSRGLASLELSPSTIGTLTTLFERAKFSLHHIDLRLRDEAISALRALQKELAGA